MKPKYSHKQGQYLSFIYYYTKLNGFPPAELDFAKYFKISAPSVHQMIIKLEQLGFIKKITGTARSIKLLLTKDKLPELE